MSQQHPDQHLQYQAMSLNLDFPDGREFREGDQISHLTRTEWVNRFQLARELMESRAHIPKILIEIAAQHPLIEGCKPNGEFEARLLKGVDIYRDLTSLGKTVEIYVPGSRHSYEGIADNLSLSKAGKQFLLKHGIPAKVIHGDDLNHRYKGDAGVYNSADECFVSASYFKDGEFGPLAVVLSPVQLMRKTLHYAWFGVLPLNYTAPTFQTYHDYLGEALDALPYVLGTDPSLQGAESSWGLKSRQTRKPKAH